MCFYDWSIYNPTNTCVLRDCIQCKNSQVLKATLSVLTCEVYHPDSDKPRRSVSSSFLTTHKNIKLVQ